MMVGEVRPGGMHGMFGGLGKARHPPKEVGWGIGDVDRLAEWPTLESSDCLA